jgi:hypothetical protein
LKDSMSDSIPVIASFQVATCRDDGMVYVVATGRGEQAIGVAGMTAHEAHELAHAIIDASKEAIEIADAMLTEGNA